MRARWPLAIRGLHWLTVLLVITTIPAVYGAIALTEVDMDAAERLIGLHILCGLAILALTALRVVARLILPQPVGVDGGPWLKLAARVATVALYGLLLALPITGILKLVLSGLDVSAFGLVIIPSFQRAPHLARVLNSVHAWLGNGLIVLGAAHAAMAFVHDRVNGVAVLNRMV